MSFVGELKRRLQMLFQRAQFQRDLDEEMRLHVELRRQHYTFNRAMQPIRK